MFDQGVDPNDQEAGGMHAGRYFLLFNGLLFQNWYLIFCLNITDFNPNDIFKMFFSGSGGGRGGGFDFGGGGFPGGFS